MSLHEDRAILTSLERLYELRSRLEATESDETSPWRAYERDPVGFITGPLGEHLWSAQREIVTSVRDHRFTAVRSCHDVGKSFTAARVVAWWLSCIPDAFAITTAPTYSQVRSILWREIARAHRKAGLPGRLNQTEWWQAGELVGIGRKPAGHDPTALQGIHSAHVLVVIDEAAGVPKALWDAAETLVTNEDSRVLVIGNPDDPFGPFASACKPGSGWNVIHIDAFSSPNFTDEQIPTELGSLLVGPTWVEERRTKWGEDSALWASKVMGNFPESTDDSLIPLAWVMRAQERDLSARAKGRPVELGVDVARYGSDRTVIGRRQGPVYRTISVTRGRSTMHTTGLVTKAMDAHGATQARIDVIGIGAGVRDRLRELKVASHGLNAGGKTTKPSKFTNARAEWYWALRKAFEENDVDLDPKDEDLAAELSGLRYEIDSRGRIRIESKDDMKKRGLASPDKADAMMLAFAPIGTRPSVRVYKGSK